MIERSINVECSDKVLKKLGIPTDSIQQCYQNSFMGNKFDNSEAIQQNLYLNKDYELRKRNFITKAPSITINDRVYLDSWKADLVFENLCASLIDKPESCYMEVNFDRNLKGVSLIGFLIILVVVVIINVGLFWICKKIIKKGVEERDRGEYP